MMNDDGKFLSYTNRHWLNKTCRLKYRKTLEKHKKEHDKKETDDNGASNTGFVPRSVTQKFYRDADHAEKPSALDYGVPVIPVVRRNKSATNKKEKKEDNSSAAASAAENSN